MHFLWLAIEDEGWRSTPRRYVEANAIALLSSFERREELDPALRRNGTEGRYGAALTLFANYTPGSFVAVADGHGDTLIREWQTGQPWLRRLRCRLPGFVRRLLSYCGGVRLLTIVHHRLRLPLR